MPDDLSSTGSRIESGNPGDGTIGTTGMVSAN
jgi:hypothetical protein